uniref:Uncharacterized protein n=1 Tax=Opuntia streptacantha TaxID=393608 RepID=A0A7C9EM69_OPUST
MFHITGIKLRFLHPNGPTILSMIVTRNIAAWSITRGFTTIIIAMMHLTVNNWLISNFITGTRLRILHLKSPMASIFQRSRHFVSNRCYLRIYHLTPRNVGLLLMSCMETSRNRIRK